MAKIYDLLKKVVSKQKEIEKKGKSSILRMKKQAEASVKAGEEVKAGKE